MKELNEMGKVMDKFFDALPHRINQAPTAIDHFHQSVAGTLAPSLQERIRNYMAGHPRKPDWTIAELAHGMGLDKSTISARRNEMLKLFILEKGPKRHCSITGVKVETVRPFFNAQVEEFKQLSRECEADHD